MIKKILFLTTIIFLNFFIFSFNVKAVETTSTLVIFTPTPTPEPTPTSEPSSNSTSTGEGWRAPDCTATKPASAPIITSTVIGDNSVTLTWSKAGNPVTKYLIAYGTKSGSIEYGNPNVGNENTTNYIVKGLSNGTKYYFKIKAINDCMPGDYSNEVSTIPGGKIIPTLAPTEIGITEITVPAEGFFPASELPSQLFDISLAIDQPQINDVSELKARATFTSFGNVDTPVKMTFVIVDENEKEYYRSNDKTTIQTEGIFNKTFKGITLPKGKYTLILTTLYNTNVKDEFKQDFEVGEVAKTNNLLMIIIGSGIGLIIISWIIALIRKMNKNRV